MSPPEVLRAWLAAFLSGRLRSVTAPSKSLLDDLAALAWLPPWAQLEPEKAREHEKTLSNSLSEEHPMHGRSAQALAARIDDAADVLFLVGDPDELCVVNLDSGSKRSADRPFFVAYRSVPEFERGCMEPDHFEYTDDDV
jgi:hypothetical protein